MKAKTNDFGGYSLECYYKENSNEIDKIYATKIFPDNSFDKLIRYSEEQIIDTIKTRTIKNIVQDHFKLLKNRVSMFNVEFDEIIYKILEKDNFIEDDFNKMTNLLNKIKEFKYLKDETIIESLQKHLSRMKEYNN